MKRFIPIAIIVLLMIVAYFTGLKDFLSVDKLGDSQSLAEQFLVEHPASASIGYILTYIIIVALSIPGATILTLIGGSLFGQPMGTIYTVIGATIGAAVLFLAAKTAIGDYLKRKAGKAFNKLEKNFQENDWNYLLFVRLVPAFPFWMINLASALLGVNFWTFLWTTAVGIIPGTFVYVQVGTGLREILASEEPFALTSILNPQLVIGLILLGLFALVPVFVKKHKNKR